MSLFGPPVPSYGPLHAPILLLGEAPGAEETERLRPFVGPSGHELRRMLSTIGIDINDTYRTNVFSRRPSDNNLALYGSPIRDGHLGHLGPLTTNPVLFCDDSHLHEVERLHTELRSVGPNVVVALGNTASWALGLGLGISALRGSVHIVQVPGLDRPLKVIPTFHPSSILRQWDQRVVALADLQKAYNESLSPEVSFDNTTLWLAPSLRDLDAFAAAHLAHATECAVDIETKRGQITCISFAPDVNHSIVVPFWIEGGTTGSYWTPEEELLAWRWVIRWMEDPRLTKVFQNGLYDLQYLMSYCTPRNCTADTMLAHHSLYSELPKGLGFLGSLYANVPSWKKMRTFKKEEALKKDD